MIYHEKITIRYLFTLSRIAVIEKKRKESAREREKESVGKYIEKLEHSYVAGGTVK